MPSAPGMVSRLVSHWNLESCWMSLAVSSEIGILPGRLVLFILPAVIIVSPNSLKRDLVPRSKIPAVVSPEWMPNLMSNLEVPNPSDSSRAHTSRTLSRASKVNCVNRTA